MRLRMPRTTTELAQESLASICRTITGAKMLPGQASQTLLITSIMAAAINFSTRRWPISTLLA
jgi:type IV secretory pathway TrbD component